MDLVHKVNNELEKSSKSGGIFENSLSWTYWTDLGHLWLKALVFVWCSGQYQKIVDNPILNFDLFL